MIEVAAQPIPQTKRPGAVDGATESTGQPSKAERAPGEAEERAFASTLLAALGLLSQGQEIVDEEPSEPTQGELSEFELASEDLEVAPDELGELDVDPDPEPTGAELDFQPLTLAEVSSDRVPDVEGSSLAGDPDRGSVAGERVFRFGPRAELGAEAPADTRADVAAAAITQTDEGADSRESRDDDDRLAARFAAESSTAPPASSFDEVLNSESTQAARIQGTESTARAELPRADGTRVLPELPVRNEASILDQTRLLLNQRGGEARIELHPPQLGNLGLRISVSHAHVQLDILADRLPVAELIHRHLPELQQALASQGLHVDRANVEYRDPGNQDARSNHTQDGNGASDRDSRGSNARADDQPRNSSARLLRLPTYSLGAIDLQA